MGIKTQEEFRGRKVFYSKGYPSVYWPNHPVARKGGIAAIHRIIAYKEYGEIVYHNHVHHLNGDVSDWRIENLEVVSSSRHAKMHETGRNLPHGGTEVDRVEVICSSCDTTFTVRKTVKNDRQFCSQKCAKKAREKTNWPSDEVLEEMVWKMPCTKIAEQLGVSDKAVAKRCNKRGIERPGRGYWQKQYAG